MNMKITPHTLTQNQLQTIQKYNITEPELERLREECTEALELSYSPYSKFRVGCVVETTEGQYIKGANIENASYGGAICAERSALCSCLNQSLRSFKAIAITSDMEKDIITPCGICRQFIREFGLKIPIVMFRKDDGEFWIKSLEELLPLSFGPGQLD